LAQSRFSRFAKLKTGEVKTAFERKVIWGLKGEKRSQLGRSRKGGVLTLENGGHLGKKLKVGKSVSAQLLSNVNHQINTRGFLSATE